MGCTDLWFLQAQYIYVLNYIFCRLEMTSGQNISCFEESNENVKDIENYFQNYFVHMWIAHLEIKAAFFFFFHSFSKVVIRINDRRKKKQNIISESFNNILITVSLNTTEKKVHGFVSTPLTVTQEQRVLPWCSQHRAVLPAGSAAGGEAQAPPPRCSPFPATHTHTQYST